MLTVLRCCIEELHANETQLADTENELMVSVILLYIALTSYVLIYIHLLS